MWLRLMNYAVINATYHVYLMDLQIARYYDRRMRSCSSLYNRTQLFSIRKFRYYILVKKQKGKQAALKSAAAEFK